MIIKGREKSLPFIFFYYDAIVFNGQVQKVSFHIHNATDELWGAIRFYDVTGVYYYELQLVCSTSGTKIIFLRVRISDSNQTVYWKIS